MYKLIYDNIKTSLIEMSNQKKYSKNIEWYKSQHKNDSAKIYNIKCSFVYDYYKTIKKQINDLNVIDKIELSRILFSSGYSEEVNIGLKIIEIEWKQFYLNGLKLIREFINYFNNWSTTDLFTLKIIQPIFDLYPDEILKLFEEWHLSDNIWKKRACLVAFTRKIASKKIYLNELIKFSNKLLNDENILIQKAIGWALKDNLRYSKKEALKYIDEISKINGTSIIINYALKEIKNKKNNFLEF